MQHLVVDDVFESVPGNAGLIKDPADYNRVMRRIVVAQAGAGVILAPGEVRACQQPMKEMGVQVVKNVFQVVDVSVCCFDALAAAHLSQQVGLVSNMPTRHVTPIACRLVALNGFTVHLGKKDVGDRSQHWLRSAFQQIGNPDEKSAFAKTDGVVYVDEGEEFDREVGNRSAGPQLSIALLEDVQKPVCH